MFITHYKSALERIMNSDNDEQCNLTVFAKKWNSTQNLIETNEKNSVVHWN